MDRRAFLKTAGAVTVITSLNRELSRAADLDMPRRTLGRSGEKVSIIGIGGYHLGRPSEQDAIRIVRTALDNGVNFLDNCWDYNGGVSEERMGKALRDGYRQKAFLMTKIDGQTKSAATRQLDDPSPLADGSCGSPAVSRGDPRHRPCADLRPWRRVRSGT